MKKVRMFLPVIAIALTGAYAVASNATALAEETWYVTTAGVRISQVPPGSLPDCETPGPLCARKYNVVSGVYTPIQDFNGVRP